MRPTSLARSVWPWHPASAWALFATAIVFVGAGISHGLDAGVRGAGAAFLAWAIVRELAPKRAVPSLLAPVAGVAFAIPAETDLLACFGVLLATRISLRSVGDPPTLLDCVVLLGGAWWLALRPEGLPVAIVLAAATYADSTLARTRRTGVAMLVVAIVAGALEGTLTMRPGWDDPALGSQVLLALVLACTPVLVGWPLPRRLRVRDDRRRGPLRGGRLRAARIVAVACVAAAVAWTGTDGVFALSSASAAIVAATLGWPGARAHAGAPARG